MQFSPILFQTKLIGFALLLFLYAMLIMWHTIAIKWLVYVFLIIAKIHIMKKIKKICIFCLTAKPFSFKINFVVRRPVSSVGRAED